MPEILHIVPHLGGGVGRVLTSLIDSMMGLYPSYAHRIRSLEYINERGVQWAAQRHVKASGPNAPQSHELATEVNAADIVHLHFWNHPLLWQFIAGFRSPARLILYAHVNGSGAPYAFPPPLLDFPDLFVVSSQLSLMVPGIAGRESGWKEERLRVVVSSGGIEPYNTVRRAKDRGLTVGYVGTVDYCKIHREFLHLFASVRNPDVRFVICGGNAHHEIAAEAERCGYASRFDFRGPVSDISSVLQGLDLFGYPLCPGNYGTGEQALIEAMAAGIPQVVIDNGPERYIVEDGVTGIVARNERAYTAALEQLLADREQREHLSRNSRIRARERFSIEVSAQAWHQHYQVLLSHPKTVHRYSTLSLRPPSAAELFCEALGATPEGGLFRGIISSFPGAPEKDALEQMQNLPPIFRSPTKGSVFHYLREFPNSAELRYLADIFNTGAKP